MTLIGLTGYAQSGKDTAAAFLVEHGWTRVAFADKLRAFAAAVNPIVKTDVGYERLVDIIAYQGWDLAKQNPEIRRLLQVIGTDAGRVLLGQNVWVDAAMQGLSGTADVVFTDVRFPNEAAAILDRGGVMVRITRPGVRAVNSHISEHALDDLDCPVVMNDSTPEVLAGRMLEVVADALCDDRRPA